jgi:hypothetical protein
MVSFRSMGTRGLRGIALAAVMGATVAGVTGCGVEVGTTYPTGYYGDYPPDSFIATTDPFYFEGHAAYWYGGRWYYRDGGRWNHYDHEPAALRERRMQSAPARHSYAPAGRGGGRSAGGRSGGHR